MVLLYVILIYSLRMKIKVLLMLSADTDIVKQKIWKMGLPFMHKTGNILNTITKDGMI